MSRRNWRNYIQGRGAPPNTVKVNAIIRDWIETYRKEANVTMEKLQEMLSKEKDGLAQAKIRMLIGRWEHIKRQCDGVSLKLD